MQHSPSDIEVLIHCHALPEVHPRITAPAVEDALRRFLRDGIIETYGQKGMYTTTMKGKAWLEMILETPYPELEYVNPLTKKFIYKEK